MALLNRYLYGQTLRGILLAFAIIISLVVLVDYVELSRRFGSFDQVSSLTILRLTLFKMPSVIEQTLPFIVLFGVMWSMFGLNRRSELVAMRAAGFSAWRFATPPAITALIIGIFGAIALNPVAANLNAKFENERVNISRNVGASFRNSGESIWLREAVAEGSLVIHAKDAIARDAELLDVTFYYYQIDPEGVPVFLKRIDAGKAQLQTDHWQLTGAKETRPGALPERHGNIQLSSNLDPASLLEYLSAASSLSFWDLPGMIEQTRAAKLETKRYELQWNRLLALPLTLAAMALIGASFSFRLARLGGTFRMAATGGAIGFALYFAADLLQALGATDVLPSFLAVWSAPAFVFFAALARITIIEDG